MTPNGSAPVLTSTCNQIRGACRESMKAVLVSEVSKFMAPLEKIEGTLIGMNEKLDELMELFDRVRALEIWKAEHQSTSSAVGVSKRRTESAVKDVREAIDFAVKESQGKIIAELKTREDDGRFMSNGRGLVVPKWAVYASIPLFLFIMMMAAIAGERLLPYLTQVPGVTQ